MKQCTSILGLWLLIGAAATLSGILLIPRMVQTTDGQLTPTVAQMRTDTIDVVTDDAVSDPSALVAPLKYHALVIGINDYRKQRKGAGWTDLQTATRDAERVAEVLGSSYGFDVTTLLDDDADYSGMMTAMDRLSRMDRGDAVLIYFAGHGYYDQALGEGYWIPSDARKTVDQRPAREDWVWNSTLSKMLQASDARHILVMADSCYSGSLLRGEQSGPGPADMAYYSKVIKQPSRYVISSGDLEPVMDTGEGHSVFARQVLQVLEHHEDGLFSGSDIGRSIQDAVHAATGQHVRFGPLFGVGGGELVLVRNTVDEETKLALYDAPTSGAGDPIPSALLADAALMYRQGAVQTARHVAGKFGTAGMVLFRGDDAASYASYSSGVNELISVLSRQEPNVSQARALPRVVANLGIQVVGDDHGDAGLASLIEMGLNTSLLEEGRSRVVNREFLEEALREQQLGTTSLSDPQAQVEIGKLLPASILLSGKLIEAGEQHQLFVQLIDTRTTELFSSISLDVASGDGVSTARELAVAVNNALISKRPLKAPVTAVKEDALTASLGAFHGAVAEMNLQVVERLVRADGEVTERPVAPATVLRLGEQSSELRRGDLTDRSGDTANWWVVEQP